jgi:hypothetical protein
MVTIFSMAIFTPTLGSQVSQRESGRGERERIVRANGSSGRPLEPLDQTLSYKRKSMAANNVTQNTMQYCNGMKAEKADSSDSRPTVSTLV